MQDLIAADRMPRKVFSGRRSFVIGPESGDSERPEQNETMMHETIKHE